GRAACDADHSHPRRQFLLILAGKPRSRFAVLVLGVDNSVLRAGGDAGSHRFSNAAVLADRAVAGDWIQQCAFGHVGSVAHLSCGNVDVRQTGLDSGGRTLGQTGMIEVEKKFRLTKRQRDAVLKRLPAVGAELESEDFEENTLFNGKALEVG